MPDQFAPLACLWNFAPSILNDRPLESDVAARTVAGLVLVWRLLIR